jgi:hypothetical protein
MAERVGFEPTVPLLAHVISSHADSAALAPLREWLLGIPANETLMNPCLFWRGYVPIPRQLFSHPWSVW